MSKIKLSLVEQKKIQFLKCLKEAMNNLNITQCVLILEDHEDSSSYWTMGIESICIDKEYQYELDDTFKSDLHFFKSLDFNYLEYAKKEYNLSSQKKLLRHLNQFHKTQFIKDILAKDYVSKNGVAWPKMYKIKFCIAQNVLGLDFSEFDQALMNKMEKVVEKSILEKAIHTQILIKNHVKKQKI